MQRNYDILRSEYKSAKKAEKVVAYSSREIERSTYQAMEALLHNLNTMHSRAGAQIPFSSLNYGTDTSHAPTTVHTSYGRTIDTSEMRDGPYGEKVGMFGDTVSKNPYTGKWEYTDSDGDTDDRATFDWD